MIKIFQNEQDELEEIRKIEKRINDFRENLGDERYRNKLRKEQKMGKIKVKDSKVKSKIFF